MLTLCEKIKNMLQIVIMKKTVIAYLHTHWDREWYREFEVFRLRLLRVFDNVLNLLETNKKAKFKMIEQIYNEYVRYGTESVVLTSLCYSCHCFQWSISRASQICFWNGRIYVNPNKRIDLLILIFSNHQITI